MKEKKLGKSNNKKILIIKILLILAFIVAITYLFLYFYNSYKNKKLYEDIKKDIKEDVSTEEISKTNSAFVEKVKELQKENLDIKGWIQIEGTNINYPLLQTIDNNYYLNHNYKKEESKYGSIFLNKMSDIKNSNSNLIIYGHNMQDSQMFGELLRYTDKTFYEQHPIIKISTEESENEYQIVSVFKSKVFYKDEKNVFKYYQYYNFENENEYNEYINNCKKIELYDTGVNSNYGEHLITLITCEYSQDNGRIVVVAKKIK